MKQAYLTTLLLITSLFGYAQMRTTTVSVQDFLEILSDHPDVLASLDEISFMQHGIDLARIGPDPQLTAGNVSGDVSGIDMPHQFYVGIDYTFETAGKRRHRIRQAKAAREVARAQHHVFENEFKHNALILYQKCWIMQQRIRDFQQYETLVKEEDITDSLDALEHKVLDLENAVIAESMKVEYDHLIEDLTALLAHRITDAMVIPLESVWNESPVMESKPVVHPASALVRAETALQYEELLLAEANAVSDVTFTLGNNFITRGTNPEAPSPQYNAITATLSVPLKLSKPRLIERKYNAHKVQVLKSGELDQTSALDAEYEANRKEVQKLASQITNIQSLILLERKLISTYPRNHEDRDEAIKKLWDLQDLRWKKFEELSMIKSQFVDPSNIDKPDFHQVTVSK